MADDEIGIFEVQILWSGHSSNFNINIAMQRIETCQARHQPLDRKARQDLQAQPTRIAGNNHVIDKNLYTIKEICNADRQVTPCVGQLNFATGFSEQLDADGRFQLLDLQAYGTRRDMQKLCGTTHAAGTVHRIKNP